MTDVVAPLQSPCPLPWPFWEFLSTHHVCLSLRRSSSSMRNYNNHIGLSLAGGSCHIQIHHANCTHQGLTVMSYLYFAQACSQKTSGLGLSILSCLQPRHMWSLVALSVLMKLLQSSCMPQQQPGSFPETAGPQWTHDMMLLEISPSTSSTSQLSSPELSACHRQCQISQPQSVQGVVQSASTCHSTLLDQGAQSECIPQSVQTNAGSISYVFNGDSFVTCHISSIWNRMFNKK